MKSTRLFSALIVLICFAAPVAATSVPANKPLAPVLVRLYEKIMKELVEAEKLTPALRNDAKEIIARLQSAGGHKEAQALIDLLKKQEMAEAPKSAAPEKVEAVQAPVLPSSDIIPVTSPLFRGLKEEINLGDTETFSGETFGELLDRQKENNDPLILARVVTLGSDGALNIHYYDAYLFNIWRFGQNYSLTAKTLPIVHADNPLNKLPVQGEIQYLIYDPSKPEKGFHYAFSEDKFKKDEKTRLIIDIDQNMDSARKKKALELKEAESVPAPRPYAQVLPPQQPEQNIQPLLDWSLNIPNVEQRPAPVVQRPQAAQDLRAVRALINEIASPNTPPVKKADKLLELGEMYFFGKGGVPEDWERAKNYLEEAANQEDNPFVQARAWLRFGVIYYAGSLEVDQNYDTAQEYFLRAANQKVDREARLQANWYIGEMYLLGDGVEPNLDEAKKYLRQSFDRFDPCYWGITELIPALNRGIEQARAAFYKLYEDRKRLPHPFKESDIDVELITAARYHLDPETVRALIKSGANVNAGSIYTPLITAVQSSDLAIARVLLNNGASISLVPPDDRAAGSAFYQSASREDLDTYENAWEVFKLLASKATGEDFKNLLAEAQQRGKLPEVQRAVNKVQKEFKEELVSRSYELRNQGGEAVRR